MTNIFWFRVGEKYRKKISAVVFESYKKTIEKRGGLFGQSWERAERNKVIFEIKKGKKIYKFVRYFSPTLFAYKAIFFDRLNYWMDNLEKHMNTKLTLDDFEWIILNKEIKSGYWSFKKYGYEICLEKGRSKWRVCLCNKFEEVIDEVFVKTEQTALRRANEFFWSFAKTGI